MDEQFLKDLSKETTKKYAPPAGQLALSTQRLVKDLEAARTAKNAKAVDKIVARARTEAYHDFLSQSATPIMDLVVALRAAHLDKLVEKAKDGDYDA